MANWREEDNGEGSKGASEQAQNPSWQPLPVSAAGWSVGGKSLGVGVKSHGGGVKSKGGGVKSLWDEWWYKQQKRFFFLSPQPLARSFVRA